MKKFVLITIIISAFTNYFTQAQIITTIAGNGQPDTTGNMGNGGPATTANILGARGVAVDKNGNLLICTWHPAYKPHVIRKINTSGTISTLAGTDTSGFTGDGGPATAARLNFPENVDIDKFNNVYIADRGNYRVRKVDTLGIITTFAGNGSTTTSGDGGLATAAGIGSCFGVCCDTFGNVYIAAGNKIRKVESSGIISTFAGMGSGLYSGDGGAATAAAITAQGQIAFDKYGNLYVAEGGNKRIRKINTAGIITTVAGDGTTGSGGDGGAATSAQLSGAVGVFPDECGNLYIADQLNNKIRVVNGSGIIKTFAGTGMPGLHPSTYSGDGGPATAARLHFPTGVYLDKTGSIYIADFNNLRVHYIHMDSCRNTVGIASPGLPLREEVLRIWPNPSSGAFSLRLSATVNETAEVVITNIVGEVVKQFSSATNNDMEVVLHAPSGVYFVSVSTASGRWVEKVLVE